MKALRPSYGKPWPIPFERSASYRWLQKPVHALRLLSDMSNPEHWSHSGPGEMLFAQDASPHGAYSLSLISPTKVVKAGGNDGRPFARSVAHFDAGGEDWQAYNRVSFWVYPDLPGFRFVSLKMIFNNDGLRKLPDSYGKLGQHHVVLRPGEWNHVVWEIADLERDCVTGIDLAYILQGNEPGATDQVCYRFTKLELEQVDADHYEGWNVAPGRISYSHTGYACGSLKSAMAEPQEAETFDLIDVATGQIAMQANAPVSQTDIGRFAILDFSAWRQSGRYRLRYGGLETQPFDIDDNVWRGTIWKTLNLFYSERCGARVPGIHELCHADWQCEHEGQRIVVNGGWHDAGDLSQGLVNTSEATYAMLALSEKLQSSDPALSEQLQQEALWGLDWALKGRFKDGYRCVWATMDYWSDGIIGTDDDYTMKAQRDALANWLAAATEALAARMLRGDDALLARRALLAAEEDWRYACEDFEDSVELAGAGVLASLELWKTTGENLYADKAVALGEIILSSQQRQAPDWTLPLLGFFYTNPKKEQVLRYFHRGHEQGPAVALCALCDALPNHARWGEWYGAAALYGEFLRRGAQLTAPYAMLVAGIYCTDEAKLPGGMQHLRYGADPDGIHYTEQLQQGIKLDDAYCLRRFPVWYAFRGNLGVLLSQAKGLSRVGQLRSNLHLAQLAEQQLQWTVGRNPFAQSLMIGEGYDFAPQYSAMCGDLVGGLPVGIETRDAKDVPYWPFTNCHNYKEIWVQPSSRWLWMLDDLAGPCEMGGKAPQGVNRFEVIDEAGQTLPLRVGDDGLFGATLSAGEYILRAGLLERRFTAMPGGKVWLDMTRPWIAALTATEDSDGIAVEIELAGAGHTSLSVRSLNVKSAFEPLPLDVSADGSPIRLALELCNSQAPWVAMVVLDDERDRSAEIVGGLPWC